MKYCKKCGVLYSDLLERCPKCGIDGLPEQPEEAQREAPRSVKVRQWIGICVGIPAMVLLLYAVVYWMKSLS